MCLSKKTITVNIINTVNKKNILKIKCTYLLNFNFIYKYIYKIIFKIFVFI